MLALGAIMAAERSFRWGRSLSVPLGVALLLAAAGLIARAPWVTAILRA